MYSYVMATVMKMLLNKNVDVFKKIWKKSLCAISYNNMIIKPTSLILGVIS